VPPPIMVVTPDIQRVFDLLRADAVDVCVDAAGGEDLPLTGDHLGAGADEDIDPRLNIGVTRLTDGGDTPVLEADIRLNDTALIEAQRVGDHGIVRAAGSLELGLPHAVADHLAAAELDLFAVDRVIVLDLYEQLGVGQAHPVAYGRAEHVRISSAGNFSRHQDLP